MDQNILEISFPRRSVPARPSVSFERREFSQILSLYGRMVSAGHWCDYAVDSFDDQAVFSIFRPDSLGPAYRIIKKINHRACEGPFSIVGGDGHIIKYGSHLRSVLEILQRKLFKLIE